MPGVGQPDALPSHKLRVDGVVCLETGGAYAATNVISAPGKFSLRTEFGFDGNLDGMLVGDTFDVVHHWERIEDGARGRLLGGPGDTNVAVVAPISHIQVTSGPYSTGAGGDLPIPGGFDAGSYRFLTHIHFHGANKGTVAGFYDGLIIVIV